MMLLVGVALSIGANAQSVSRNRILLKGQTLYAGGNLDEWVAKCKSGQIKFPVQVLVHFNALPDDNDKELLVAQNIELDKYLPENTYIAVFQHDIDNDIAILAGVDFITEVQSGWKYAQPLKDKLTSDSDAIDISVSFTKRISKETIKAKIAEAKGTIIRDRYNTLGYFDIHIPQKNLSALIDWYGVEYVGLYYEDVALNTTAKAITGIRSVYKPVQYGGLGLNGDGIAIGVGDNTSGIYHIDLRDRVVNYTPAGYTNHGVHINGIVGGAGIIDIKGEGMATHALLVDHYFSDVLSATPDIYKKYNVNVTNNSYSANRGSCEYAGTYDHLSEGLDQLCLAYPNVLQVFAAANDGYFDCQPYPTGFATIAGGYQVAKNILVVTSTDKQYQNAGNASRGPVRDGRLKPEISAVGVDVNSDTRSEEYLVASGTSMACPQVAAAAGLLTQRYKQFNGNALPRADVLKALLVNGSIDIGNKGPDYRYGFGFLNLKRSVQILDSGWFYSGVLKNSQTETKIINVPANTAQLKVFVTWMDPASSPLSATQLINDIDLEVRAPNNTLHLPLVLNSTPGNMLDLAVEKVDRLNNSEQVVIDDPVAGQYTISIKGFNIPVDSQRYVVSYDFVPAGLEMKFPETGDAVLAGDTINVYWDESESNSDLTLEFSDNNGGSWVVVVNDIPAGQRYYSWAVPQSVSSGLCQLRLTRNSSGEMSETGLFAVTPIPEPELDAIQCPGYINVNWSSIKNAAVYEVMLKAGPHMTVIDTTADTSYTYKGLVRSVDQYIAIRPIVDGLSGYRSIALKRRPDDGNCAGSISDGDLLLSKIVAPVSGRKFTGSELTNNESLTVRVFNLDDVPCDSYKLSYNLNGAGWIETVFNQPIAAGLSRDVSVNGINMSATGFYSFDVAITNLSLNDSVNVNDSLATDILHITNAPITLDFLDDFEAMPSFEIYNDTIGIGDAYRWDFESKADTGRVRSYVLDNVIIDGNRSISMDAYKSTTVTQNILTSTFNLSNYTANNDEVRLEFDYIIHGKPKTEFGNVVWLRGKDTRAFNELYYYSFEPKTTGTVQNSGSISLNDLLQQFDDSFSASTQLVFGQNDTSVIGSRNFGNGVTIDNVKLYTVQNDIQLLSIVSPESFACGIDGPAPLTIEVRNGVNQTLNNILLNYKLDNNVVVTENLSSISGKETLRYTFSQQLDLAKTGTHNLDVWISVAGDTYNKNDSIFNFSIRNQPVVNSYPYTEDFEANDGFWFTDGINSSWEYGTPSAAKIDKAASGKKAWVTNLDGNYNTNETGYLYSPCFDISMLQNPNLSFNAVFDIENCNTILCDAAYIEFTENGQDWYRLISNTTTNWYSDTTFRAWTVEDKTIWHPVSATLPDSISNIQLRFVLNTDPGSEREGFGVDDIKLYDNVLYPGNNEIISISPNPTTDGKFAIDWQANTGTEFNLIMADVSGRQVLNVQKVAQQGYNKTTIQAPMLSSGVYFLRITIGDKEYKEKIVYTRR